MRTKAQLTIRLVRYLDVLLLAAVEAVLWEEAAGFSQLAVFGALLIVPVHASLLQYYGLYESHRIEGVGLVARNLLSAHAAALVFFGLLFPFFAIPHWRFLAAFSLITFTLVLLGRVLLLLTLRVLRSQGFDIRRVCLIGPAKAAVEFDSRFAANPAWGMRTHYLGDVVDGSLRIRDAEGCRELGADLGRLLMEERVDEVVIICRPEEVSEYRGLMNLCKDHGVTARLVMHQDKEEDDGAPEMEEFLGASSLALHAAKPDAAGMAGKRLLDIIFSAVVLLILSPLLLAIAVLVKLSSPGPVVFRQRRVGLGGRHFTILKFRTMVEGAEGLLPSLAARNITEGPAFKSRDDWRVTPLGRWLRRYSLDELPQFANVVLGDMSLVGPRPLPVQEARAVERAFRRRFAMRPGLTCFWQVSGRSEITFTSWMKMDLEYIDKWSLWLDAKLIFRTIPVVLSGRGAY